MILLDYVERAYGNFFSKVGCCFVLILTMISCSTDKEMTTLKVHIDRLLKNDTEIVRMTSITDVEQESLEQIKNLESVPKVPFGYVNDKWNEFKKKYKKGDLLIYFKTDSKSWDGLYGREGLVLLRGNHIVDIFFTSVS